MQDRDIGKFARRLVGKTFTSKVLVLPIATAALLGSGGESLNSYKEDEIATISRWQGYEPTAQSMELEDPQMEPITLQNALGFLSVDEKVKLKGYLKVDAGQDVLHFTSRTAAQETYGLNLVLDVYGERVVVDNQRGFLNLMRLQKDFEDGDRRLIAFSMITGSSGGYEGLSTWRGEQAEVDIDHERNVAIVSMWKVYAEGSYPTRTNLMTEDQRGLIEQAYISQDIPQHGEVYKIVKEVDLSYIRGSEPTNDLASEFVGIKWDVWNR